MKITIELKETEVKGIKAYLKDVDGNENPNKEDVKIFIEGLINTMYSPSEAVSDYIAAACIGF